MSLLQLHCGRLSAFSGVRFRFQFENEIGQQRHGLFKNLAARFTCPLPPSLTDNTIRPAPVVRDGAWLENGDTNSVSLDFLLWQSRYRWFPTRSRARLRPDTGQAALSPPGY